MMGTSSPLLPSAAFTSLHTNVVAPFGPQLLHSPAGKHFDESEFSSSIGNYTDVETVAPTSPTTHYTEVVLRSLVTFYNKMLGTGIGLNGSCQADCSGRGECLNGTCFCLVQYEGESCNDPNVAYFASFSCIFFCIAAISLGQLVVCVRAEYQRLKAPTFRKACGVTTQKMLYMIMFVAAAIRGAYFSSPSNAELTLASSFLSSFYPMILSGGSLIVCFWAEAFHLRDIHCEHPRFLGKSFLGFVTFNVITYSLFVAEVFLQRYAASEEERSFFTHVFNGCYAVLMFIMVVFFLVYGVEVYFKVRGGFVTDTLVMSTLHCRTTRSLAAGNNRVSFSVASSDVEGDACPSTQTGAAAAQALLPSRYRVEDDADEDGLIRGDCGVSSGSMEVLSCSSNSTSTTTLSTASSDDAVADCLVPLLEYGNNCVDAQGQSEDGVIYQGRATKQECGEATEALTSLWQQDKVRVGGDVSSSETFHDCKGGVDYSQLSQSRFGLVFQACMLMITVCFLFSDVLGGFWKSRVPLISRNAYDIVFRVVELGVALWFPCVLWNCIAPEQLWILNPRKILKKIDINKSIPVVSSEQNERDASTDSSDDAVATKSSSSSRDRECWICYETEANTSAGSMIEPCLCRGDVAAVHHNCLRQWLVECAQTNNTERLACKVCQAEYELERSPSWSIGQGFTARHWLHTASLVTIMCGTIAGSWTVLQMYQDAMVRSMTAGAMLLMIYLCLRFLGFNTFTAYQRARYSAVKILSRHFTSSTSNSNSDYPSSSSSSSVASAVTDSSSCYSDDGSAAPIDGQVAVDIAANSLST